MKKLHWTDSEFDRTYFLLLCVIPTDLTWVTRVPVLTSDRNRKVGGSASIPETDSLFETLKHAVGIMPSLCVGII